jgi:hypothetical protein
MSSVVTPLFERRPRVVTGDRHLVEIIHAGAAEVPVRDRKSGGLDDVGGHIEACAEAKNRPGVLGDVGLEKCDLHSTKGLGVAMICLDNSPLGADLVHCTQMSR